MSERPVVCKHGALERQCDRCELEAEREALVKERDTLAAILPVQPCREGHGNSALDGICHKTHPLPSLEERVRTVLAERDALADALANRARNFHLGCVSELSLAAVQRERDALEAERDEARARAKRLEAVLEHNMQAEENRKPS